MNRTVRRGRPSRPRTGQSYVLTTGTGLGKSVALPAIAAAVGGLAREILGRPDSVAETA